MTLTTNVRRSLVGAAIACALGATATALPALADAPPASPTDDGTSAPLDQAPVGNLAGWRQIFVDDFTVDVPLGSFPAATPDWRAYPSPWRDTTGKGLYAPEKVVSIDDGVLTKSIRTVDGTPLVSALTPNVPGNARNGQLYGRYSVRFRADNLPGYKVAWMLWPDSSVWPRDGEIDFPEMNLDSSNVFGFVHRQGAKRGSDQAAYKISIDRSLWHVATVEWSPGLVVMYLDGREVARTTDRVPSTPMHWVLQTETSLTNWRRKPDPAVAGAVQIDWVAAWAYDPAALATAPATIDLTVPSGSTLSGVAPLTAEASDGVQQVKWYVDGVEVASHPAAPWTDVFTTGNLANGPHRMFAKARSSSGTWITSEAITVHVQN